MARIRMVAHVELARWGAEMDVSVVVPCWNEAENLAELCLALTKVLQRLTSQYEVILVDDGSTDSTWEEMQRVHSENGNCRAVRLSRNFGKESALYAGILRARGHKVAIMDADGQHPPELLGRMISTMDSGFDQVVARRSREGEPWLRNVLSRAYYRVMSRLSEVPLADGAGDFRVLSRRAADAVLALPEQNRFSKGLFSWLGFPTAEIAYPNQHRRRGRSSWSWSQLVNYGIDGVVAFTTKPLRVSTYVGCVVSALALVGACGVVARTALSGADLPGYATLIVTIAGLGGLQLLFLGVIGEYLGRLYLEAKRRPHFFVQESVFRPENSEDRALPSSQSRGHPSFPGLRGSPAAVLA